MTFLGSMKYVFIFSSNSVLFYQILFSIDFLDSILKFSLNINNQKTSLIN